MNERTNACRRLNELIEEGLRFRISRSHYTNNAVVVDSLSFSFRRTLMRQRHTNRVDDKNIVVILPNDPQMNWHILSWRCVQLIFSSFSLDFFSLRYRCCCCHPFHRQWVGWCASSLPCQIHFHRVLTLFRRLCLLLMSFSVVDCRQNKLSEINFPISIDLIILKWHESNWFISAVAFSLSFASISCLFLIRRNQLKWQSLCLLAFFVTFVACVFVFDFFHFRCSCVLQMTKLNLAKV